MKAKAKNPRDPADSGASEQSRSGDAADEEAGSQQRARTSSLQTLDRGLDVLEMLARQGPTVSADVASALGLHRSIVYRILRTLEQRGFAERDVQGRYALGPALAMLGHAVRQDLQSAALPVLTDLSDATNSTAFIVIPDGDDGVTLVTVQPRQSAGQMVVYRPTARHPLSRGAPGLAILAARPPSADDLPGTIQARETGYVRTVGELTPGLSGLAAPLFLNDGSVASIAIVFVAGHLDEDYALDLLLKAASRLSSTVVR